MPDRRAVTLRLPAEDFARLEAEARRAGVRPGTFARLVIHRYLREPREEPKRALERLGALRRPLPRIDAVELVREGRAELEAKREGWPLAVVLDASLLVAISVNDPRADLVSAALLDWLDAGEDLHLPELALYELASGLTRAIRAGALPGDQVSDVWDEIRALSLAYHGLDDGPRAVEIARSLDRTSAYDAAYLALAESLGADLWTLDARLHRNASERGYPVQLLEEKPPDGE